MKTKERKKSETITLKRQYLAEMSQKARKHIDKMFKESKTEADRLFWASRRINDVLAMWYREKTGAGSFKTFPQWKKEGYNVKKGEKAFLLWSRKQKVSRYEDSGNGEEPAEENYEFFPIAYLFSDLQVEKTETSNVTEEKEAEYV
jgi:hypothetical protein